MLARAVVALLPLPLLAACSLSWHSSRVSSSLPFGPGERATLRVRTVPPSRLALELRGLGPGAIAFEARTPEGTLMVTGSLAAGDQARCNTSEGALVVTFAGGEQGGTIAYEAFGADGMAIELDKSQP